MATRGWQHVQAIVSPAKVPQKRATMPQERRSKYRAIRTEVNGFTFDSKAEARRYSELLMYGAAGAIRNLELQPRFPLRVNGGVIGAYVADFRYEERNPNWYQTDTGGAWVDVVEDVKGWRTLPIARWKIKHFTAQYGLTVREIR